jgi:HD-GYP domain-containing protein (c-di-GMP phosphodiesterase class II)
MNLIAKFPIYDLNGQLLVSAGTELSPAFMEDLCSSNPNQYEVIPLLHYGSILKDLMRQFTIPPYDVIFSQDKASLTVLDVMERVRLPLPILQAMDYFREKDFHTYRHMLVISALSTLIIQEIDPDYSKLHEKELAYFGPSHDIGKITVPIEILLKKTPLTHGELDLLKNHALAGYVLLSYYLKDEQSFASLIARDHHERRNGTGYPTGMKQINLIVEITTVCDIYDALVAQRPYRPVSYDNRSAIEELTLMAERGDIGWKAVQILVAYNRHDMPDPIHIKVSTEKRGKAPEQNVYRTFAD